MVLLSVVAAIMSFTYSSIGLGLGITEVIGKVHFDSLRFYLLIKKKIVLAISR
jgi:hypothetical protein